MASLNITNKRRVEDIFVSFMEKEKVFFKESINEGYGYGNDVYEVEIKNIYGDDYPAFKAELNKEYLWCDKAVQKINKKDFNFKECDFSFYFKFIRESQDVLNTKEASLLLKNKLFSSQSNVIDELVGLNNNEINKFFFTHSFLVSNLDLFAENYKRFSFTHEDDKYFFNILKSSEFFKKDDFRNKVYRLVRNKFTDPDFFKQNFPIALNDETSKLFIANTFNSSALNFNKSSLDDFNLMRRNHSKNIRFLLSLVYRLVKGKFTNPNISVEKFPSAPDIKNSKLYSPNLVKSFHLSANKDDLYDFNLMREYHPIDIHCLLHLMLEKISERGNFFGINNYKFSQHQCESLDKAVSICFLGDNGSDLKVELLSDVFNKYVLSILKENTVENAVDQIKSGNILEKIILEKVFGGVGLEKKKNKI